MSNSKNIFIVLNATINAISVPSASICSWGNDISGKVCKDTAPAPMIVGIPRRKEKVTIFFRGILRRVPPISVAPARETPGINASICVHPIMNASRYERGEELPTSFGWISRRAIPPTMSAIAMTRVLLNNFSIKEWIVIPTTAVGKNPTITLRISVLSAQSIFQKKTTAARIAPVCIATVNVVKNALVGM